MHLQPWSFKINHPSGDLDGLQDTFLDQPLAPIVVHNTAGAITIQCACVVSKPRYRVIAVAQLNDLLSLFERLGNKQRLKRLLHWRLLWLQD